MKDEAILSTGKFVEVGRADLVGQHVGHTAPLVKKKFRDAQGGVLFIDEAYSLWLTLEDVSTIKESDIPEDRTKECNKIAIGF